MSGALAFGVLLQSDPGTLQYVIDQLTNVQLWLGAFAGGAFGAALGALPVFIFTGFLVVAGEAAVLANPDAAALTGSIAFGPVFGPHTSFAGGAAAVAYAARRGYMDTGFDYHEAKNILFAQGSRWDVLAVGGLFGVLGMLIRQVSGGFLLPWDPIAMGVTLGALFHRVILGYSIIGKVEKGLLNMRPFEQEEHRQAAPEGDVAADGGTVQHERLLVEPWLPHQYKWGNVAFLGLAVGLGSGYLAYATGSAFLGFGISAASLVFLNCGVEQTPVTHHITLPSATAFLAVSASGDAVLAGLGVGAALAVAAIYGIFGALVAELHQRIFYSHGDTHWDPPASSIVVTTFTIAVLTIAGVFPTAVWVPTL
ncbi:MAG: hypothetical protein ABEJ89_07740 [Haloarculaceae archaeon]